MRSGITTGHKILKFLKSGVAVDVVEFSEDKKYASVVVLNDASKAGWVESKLLMPTKSARVKIKAIKQNSIRLQEKYSEIKEQLATAQNTNKELTNIKLQLENDVENLQKILTNLRERSSDPIRIARENSRLKKQLGETEIKLNTLAQRKETLESQSEKQWFMVGAAISIGSLLLGVLLTRIRWTKKESWGGNGF
ncbi:hypothetical protein MNBD_GAMMA07-2285 [hydrothermal vent metagenome]|uniref:SH3b domain-containing protein n=1 Tax=hydrothermal vent metagenome TaxID=652676 RepID=A0A3B0WXI0_9ZZZZ